MLQLDHVMPLSEAAAAHRLVEERKSTGKVVLLPW
jgi:NADPH2:quinone reductase